MVSENGGYTFAVLDLEDKASENGDRIAGLKLNPVAWVIEESITIEFYLHRAV
jgi:hypothetical protein